jgi:MFS family permease
MRIEFFGQVSDYINRKKLLMTGTLVIASLSYPLFCGLTRFGEWFVWVFIFGFAILGATINGSYVVMITESFPANLRYSGVGLSYSLGVAVFGGLAPLMFTWLIQFFKFAEAPAIYISVCAFLTLIATISYNDDGKLKCDPNISKELLAI